MNLAKQIVAVVGVNFLSLPRRIATSLVIVIGIAGVVAVLISVLSVSTGLTGALTATGRPDRAIVLHAQSQAEVGSTLARDAVLTVLDKPGIAHGPDGKVLASAEMLATVESSAPGQRSSRLAHLARRLPAALRRATRDQARRGPHLSQWTARGHRGTRCPGSVSGPRYRRQGALRGDRVDRRRRLRQRRRRARFGTAGGCRDGAVRVSANHVQFGDAQARWRARPRPVAKRDRSGSDALGHRCARDRLLRAAVAAVRALPEHHCPFHRRHHGGRRDLRGPQHHVLSGQFPSRRDRDAACHRLQLPSRGDFRDCRGARARPRGCTDRCFGCLAPLQRQHGEHARREGDFPGGLSICTSGLALIGLGIIWACVVGLIGGLLPAIRAARVPVATALRAL